MLSGFESEETMDYPSEKPIDLKFEMANRLFFRLYQCANMLHKTGSRAIEAEGLTTQQWAVLGALSRPEATNGMSMGHLARYLLVSRQNLAGVIGRMERAGHLQIAPDPQDRRSRLVRVTPSGLNVWRNFALPKIHDYYLQALADFSTNDTVHAVHYLLKILENMKRIDAASGGDSSDEADEAADPTVGT